MAGLSRCRPCAEDGGCECYTVENGGLFGGFRIGLEGLIFLEDGVNVFQRRRGEMGG